MPLGVAEKTVEGEWPWPILGGGENGENLGIICMGGQGHIFTFDLIFSGWLCYAEGSCIQWTVLLLLEMTKLYIV